MAAMGNGKLKSLTPKAKSVKIKPVEPVGLFAVTSDAILCMPANAISIAPIMPEGFITDSQLMPPRSLRHPISALKSRLFIIR